MMLIDSHCHIDAEEFDNDRDIVVQNAKAAGVGYILIPNVDISTIDKVIGISDLYPGYCFPMIGIHPTSVMNNYEDEIKIFEKYLGKHSFIGIGEIGIDLYWDKTYYKEQEKAFIYQLNIASEAKLPVVIHSRSSLEELIGILKKENIKGLEGVFHCFPGGVEQAKRVIDLGFYLGIGGVVTYKNSGMGKLFEGIDISRVILETDAPYLTPAPHRGKRNESSMLVHIAEKISELTAISVEEVARLTSENTLKLFNIS
jgi:TatD DNase family protein